MDYVDLFSAGTTDSPLTTHGVLQANRLGSHLFATDMKIAHVFSSDLQRAVMTAEAIREPQIPEPPPTTKLELLREQDFGFYEGKQYFERPKDSGKSGKEAHQDAHRNEPGFKDMESKESMKVRMEKFVEQHLRQLLHEVQDEHTVTVVAHGIILNYLWRSILVRFSPGRVSVTPSVQGADRGFSLEYLGGWSNTGYLELDIRKNGSGEPSSDKKITAASSSPATSKSAPVAPSAETSEPLPQDSPIDTKPRCSTSPPKLFNMSMVVKAVNCQEHLKGLKKTRGGIGSLKHDSSQKTMDSFFKKRRLG